jgi:hypothetical protein
MKKAFLICLLISLVSCKNVSENVDTRITIDTTAIAVDTMSNYVPAIAKNNEWKYDTSEDKMTSNITKFASITSNESLSLDFPYDGINMGTLQLRKKNGALNIMVLIDKGQISSDYDDQNVKVRFDDDKAITFSYSKSADNSSDLIFIDNVTKFLSKLKKSKKTLIGLPLYQNGTQILEFKTENLKW